MEYTKILFSRSAAAVAAILFLVTVCCGIVGTCVGGPTVGIGTWATFMAIALIVFLFITLVFYDDAKHGRGGW